MRCGREEQAVLEAIGQIPDRLRELARDRVSRTAGRSSVVGLVQNEERAGAETAKRPRADPPHRSHRSRGGAI